MHGSEVSCRIDAVLDILAGLSSTIVDFLDVKSIFLSTRGMSNPRESLDAVVRTIKYCGEVQIIPMIDTVSGPLRLQNIAAKIRSVQILMSYLETTVRVRCYWKTPLLKAAGLDVKCFFVNHIDHLSSLDFGAITSNGGTSTVGDPGKTFSNDVIFWFLRA